VGGLTFQVSASSFFQTNTRQAERLFELVIESAGLTGTETVYDLYSGTGAISLLLARRARWVYGVEVAQAAVDDAGVNAAANRITNCTFVCREVRFVLPSLIAKGVTAEVVVADPPRGRSIPRRCTPSITLGAPHRLRVVQSDHAGPGPGRAGARGLPARVGAAGRHVPAHPHIEAVARLERVGS
jgi:23S rRNA (uracil1939-C5)-methyltransferase